VRARLHGAAGARPRRRGAHAAPPDAGAHVWVDVAPILDDVCDHASRGYREPYKREVIGVVLGRVRRSGDVACLRAVPYATPFRTRTQCDPNPQALRRRARALAAATGLRWLGCYHSHPEERNSRAHALSREDREIFLDEPEARIEVVVSVAGAGRCARIPAAYPRTNRDGSLSFWCEGFCYRLSADAKSPRARRRAARRP
jgi:hypothetical protein